MSRFLKFQGCRVLKDNGEPLDEQIYVSECIINFNNGFISNLFREENNYYLPAIECSDTHIEYWENGKLHRNNGPAVISLWGEKHEYWHEGELKNKELGIIAEENFANYLNENHIPFIHLDQNKGKLFSNVFWENKIKRPDYIIFII